MRRLCFSGSWLVEEEKKVYIYILKTFVFVIIREPILLTVIKLSFYSHTFQVLAFFFQNVLKTVIRNNDFLIFIPVSNRKYIRIYVFFPYSIAGTYFNQHHYIFSILNPCRRLYHLLGPFSDKHRIVHIYSHAFLPDIQYPCPFIFYRHRMHLF